ncbi:hypothetical protein AB3329_10520, partial [Streptococcus sp. H31]|uniref:hypothetical protein n=1 Tax=Streptococcus huangxiaojuni TaxID=3237239 RepID=UPI0034A43D65
LKTSSNAVSSKGRYTSSQSVPVKGSALDKGLFNGSYQYAFDQNGVSGLSAALSGENSRSEFGVKYVNGTLAAYSQTQSSASAALSDTSKGELSVAYEQGQYIRKSGDSPHMTQAAYLVDDIRGVNWGQATSDVAQGTVNFVADNAVAIGVTVASIAAIGLATVFGGAGAGLAIASVIFSAIAADKDSKNDMEK